jgi:putative MATE family efflux protein
VRCLTMRNDGRSAATGAYLPGVPRPRLPARDAAIVRLALPALGALVAEPLFLLADAAVVGRLGTVPLAGLGLAGTVLATVVGLCIFLAYSTTAAVARRVGADQPLRAVQTGVDGLWFAAALGTLLATVGVLLGGVVVSWFGAEGAVVDQATSYLRISAVGLPSMLLVLAALGALRGLQDTMTTLLVTAAASLLNVILAITFVLVLHWGIAGSAWATVTAQTLAALTFVVIIAVRARRVTATLRPDLPGIRSVARTGGPLFLRTIALRAVFVLAVGVAARLGTADLAVYHVCLQVWMLLALALDALAIAAQALIGAALGAGDRARARDDLHRLLQWGVGAGLVLAALVALASPVIPMVFSSDPAVRHLMTVTLLVIAAHQLIAGRVFVLDGVLIGAGDARWLAGAGFVVLVAFVPAAALVLYVQGNVVDLWLALLWFMVIRLLVLERRARSDAWIRTGAALP